MKKNKAFTLIITALILGGFAAQEASAWGPRSRRALTGTSLQMLRRSYPDAFKGQSSNFEQDLVRGALDGPSALRESLPIGDDAALMNSIGAQINLLREARRAGVGSYFAYRMGILSSLVADFFLPYATDNSPEGRQLLSRLQADIEAHLDEFRYQPRRSKLFFIRYPNEYLHERRQFFDDAGMLIAADYGPGGSGYNGYMKKGGEAFFSSAVEGITDVWHTVLSVDSAAGTGIGSSTDVSLTWYLVDNIEYLLTVKRNVREAEQAADLFMAENRNDFAAYEKVGDYFYGFGGEMGTDLGLRMWETSLTSSGTERRRVLSKLAKHYLDEGRSEFDNAFKPEAPKDALQRAKVHFLRALEYDRSSEEAAGLVREVDTEIEAKEQRQLFMIDLVSGGQEMMRLAEGNVTRSLYEAALPQFEKAIHTFRQVDDEFEEQQEAAREGAERCQVQIARLITSVLEEGRSVLNQGDDLFDQKKFDEAISTYERVPAQVDFLNRVDLVPSQKGELDDLLAQADDSVIKADQEKRRAEAAAANPQPAGLPGATPPPALPGRGGGILPGAGGRGGQ